MRRGVGWGSTDAVDASPSLYPSLAGLEWKTDPAQATMSDILRVHEYPYVAHIQTICKWVGLRWVTDRVSGDATRTFAHRSLEGTTRLFMLDEDTTLNKDSFAAAATAAGAVVEVSE